MLDFFFFKVWSKVDDLVGFGFLGVAHWTVMVIMYRKERGSQSLLVVLELEG